MLFEGAKDPFGALGIEKGDGRDVQGEIELQPLPFKVGQLGQRLVEPLSEEPVEVLSRKRRKKPVGRDQRAVGKDKASQGLDPAEGSVPQVDHRLHVHHEPSPVELPPVTFGLLPGDHLDGHVAQGPDLLHPVAKALGELCHPGGAELVREGPEKSRDGHHLAGAVGDGDRHGGANGQLFQGGVPGGKAQILRHRGRDRGPDPPEGPGNKALTPRVLRIHDGLGAGGAHQKGGFHGAASRLSLDLEDSGGVEAKEEAAAKPRKVGRAVELPAHRINPQGSRRRKGEGEKLKIASSDRTSRTDLFPDVLVKSAVRGEVDAVAVPGRETGEGEVFHQKVAVEGFGLQKKGGLDAHKDMGLSGLPGPGQEGLPGGVGIEEEGQVLRLANLEGGELGRGQ